MPMLLLGIIAVCFSFDSYFPLFISWDRMPFLTNLDGREPNFTPLPTMTSQNLIFANYGASEGFDNDDGSSFYHTFNNVFYSSDGFKMDVRNHQWLACQLFRGMHVPFLLVRAFQMNTMTLSLRL